MSRSLAQTEQQLCAWVIEHCRRQAPRYRMRGEAIQGEVWLRIHKAMNDPKETIRDLEAYVAAACRHEIRRVCLKERKESQFVGLDAAEEVPQKAKLPLNCLICQEEQEALTCALDGLPNDQRETLEAWLEGRERNRAMKHLANRRAQSRQATYQMKKRVVCRLRQMLNV